MIAPSGLAKRESAVHFNGSSSLVGPIGKGYLVVRSRLRITRDGGHSLLASRSVDREATEQPIRASMAKQPVDPWTTGTVRSPTPQGRPEMPSSPAASGLVTPSSSISQVALPTPAPAPPLDKATTTLLSYLHKERVNGNRVTWNEAKSHLFDLMLLKGGSSGPSARAKAIFLDAEQAGLIKVNREGSASYLELVL